MSASEVFYVETYDRLLRRFHDNEIFYNKRDALLRAKELVKKKSHRWKITVQSEIFNSVGVK